jgi:UDP-glucose 4-epimerase
MEGLADKIIEITCSKSKKEFIPYEVAYGRPIEDMMRRVPCLDKIKDDITWQPKTGFKEMLLKVKNNLK